MFSTRQKIVFLIFLAEDYSPCVTVKCKHIFEISNESLKIYEEYRIQILDDTVVEIKLKTRRKLLNFPILW